MKILIVDDEEVSLTSVRRILKWRGIRDVEVCDNGKDAIKRIKEKEPAAFVDVFARDHRIKGPDKVLLRKQAHVLTITRF